MSKSKPQTRPVAQQQGLTPRKGTKQEKLIAMLRRKEGATIKQLARALAWQPHTVHGVLSGTIRKRLGLNVVGTSNSGSRRTYRIVVAH
jgi:DNA-binding MarR family transcriptional regulator